MTSESRRRRYERSPSPTYKLDDEDDTYEPYVPVSQRRQEKLAKLSSLGFNSSKKTDKTRLKEEQEAKDEEQQEEEIRKEKSRKERTLLVEAQEVLQKKAVEGIQCSFKYPRLVDEHSLRWKENS